MSLYSRLRHVVLCRCLNSRCLRRRLLLLLQKSSQNRVVNAPDNFVVTWTFRKRAAEASAPTTAMWNVKLVDRPLALHYGCVRQWSLLERYLNEQSAAVSRESLIVGLNERRLKSH